MLGGLAHVSRERDHANAGDHEHQERIGVHQVEHDRCRNEEQEEVPEPEVLRTPRLRPGGRGLEDRGPARGRSASGRVGGRADVRSRSPERSRSREGRSRSAGRCPSLPAWPDVPAWAPFAPLRPSSLPSGPLRRLLGTRDSRLPTQQFRQRTPRIADDALQQLRAVDAAGAFEEPAGLRAQPEIAARGHAPRRSGRSQTSPQLLPVGRAAGRRGRGQLRVSQQRQENVLHPDEGVAQRLRFELGRFRQQPGGVARGGGAGVLGSVMSEPIRICLKFLFDLNRRQALSSV